jgi:hypothetical protein
VQDGVDEKGARKGKERRNKSGKGKKGKKGRNCLKVRGGGKTWERFNQEVKGERKEAINHQEEGEKRGK